jgi:hypothetical protein
LFHVCVVSGVSKVRISSNKQAGMMVMKIFIGGHDRLEEQKKMYAFKKSPIYMIQLFNI